MSRSVSVVILSVIVSVMCSHMKVNSNLSYMVLYFNIEEINSCVTQ